MHSNNLRIISADWILTCDSDNSIIKDGAIVFDNKIVELGTQDSIKQKYPTYENEHLGENSVILPGLINSHIHLEFSANSTSLKYGNFMQWLYSVIKNRDELINSATKELIDTKLKMMKKSGTTTIGAISSYSFDLKSCVDSKLNTVFFCEVIGSKAEMVDALFSDFKSRLDEALKYKSENFIPAVAIHSPYSVHPFLLRESLQIAKQYDMSVSAHYLESKDEYEWLMKNSGGFLDFFKNFLGQDKSVSEPIEFLNSFKGIDNLSFTHCVEAKKDELSGIEKLGAVINHCPTSNRLLTNSKLNLDNLGDIKYSIGTDGLSSNNSLSMFDELRTALMIHQDKNVVDFSNTLLKAATVNGAVALGLKKGVLKKDFDADMIVTCLPNSVEDKDDVALHTILHTKFVNKSIIGGKNV